jgi:hypothetical protein
MRHLHVSAGWGFLVALWLANFHAGSSLVVAKSDLKNTMAFL